MEQLNLLTDQPAIVVYTSPKAAWTYSIRKNDGTIFGSDLLLTQLLLTLNELKDQFYKDALEALVLRSDGKQYQVIGRDSHVGIEMSAMDGSAQDILNSMFAAVAGHSHHPSGKAKAPWKMLRKEWNAITSISSVAFGTVPCFGKAHAQSICQTRDGSLCSITEYLHSEFRARFGYGSNGPAYNNCHDTNSRHDVHIGYAMVNGLPIPDAVLEEYVTEMDLHSRCDMPWFKLLLAFPTLRGALKEEQLAALVYLTNDKDSLCREVTQENVAQLKSLVCSISAASTSAEYDDLFFTNGLLAEISYKPQLPGTLGDPLNPFAKVLREMLVADQRLKSEERYAKEALQGHVSLRLKQLQAKSLADHSQYVTYSHANRVAQAIVDKNMVFLISYLDHPDNLSTKKAIREVYGIELINVTAKARRRGIFMVAGYSTDESYQDAEARFKAEQEKSLATKRAAEAIERQSRELQSAKEVAGRKRFKINEGTVLNGAEFVENLISRGFTKLVDKRAGASLQHFIMNPADGSGYRLKSVDGTYPYAALLLNQKV